MEAGTLRPATNHQRPATNAILARVRLDISTKLQHRGRQLRLPLVLLAVILALAGASNAFAQAGLTDPPRGVDPTPVPTPAPASNDAPGSKAAPGSTDTPAPDAASGSEDASDPDDPTVREQTVPEEEEAASSDRIQYRDPLDIDEVPVKLKWKNFVSGLRGITQYSFFNNQLRFRLGGRFQADGTLAGSSNQLELDLGHVPNSLRLRRFRIFAEGIIKRMYFRIEFDFAADAGFKSLYFEGKDGGLAIWDHLLGKFRYGYFQEPFSLEQNVSSFDTTFVEVSLPVATFAPGNNIGAMVYDASSSRRFTWAFGAFSWGSADANNASTSVFSLTGRFGYQPVHRNNNRTTLHLGFSVSARSPAGGSVQYKSRPEARFVQPFADTGEIVANKNNLIGFEAAWRKNSTWAQAEFIRSNLASSTGDDPHFGGYVLQLGQFFSGVTRPWDTLFGVWGRVRPEQNYRGGNPFKQKNGGVWEVAARYSTVDLDNGEVEGGTVRDLTAGINWYPNSTSKLQFNWIFSSVEDSGNANIWVLRYQYAIK